MLQWDPSTEMLVLSAAVDAEQAAAAVRRGELDSSLGPYPLKTHDEWVGLSRHLDEAVIRRAGLQCGTFVLAGGIDDDEGLGAAGGAEAVTPFFEGLPRTARWVQTDPRKVWASDRRLGGAGLQGEQLSRFFQVRLRPYGHSLHTHGHSRSHTRGCSLWLQPGGALGESGRASARTDLPRISHASPMHLPCISHASPRTDPSGSSSCFARSTAAALGRRRSYSASCSRPLTLALAPALALALALALTLTLTLALALARVRISTLNLNPEPQPQPQPNLCSSGELQLSFVLFLLVSSLGALTQWKALLHTLCKSDSSLAHRPTLYLLLLPALTAQLKLAPEVCGVAWDAPRYPCAVYVCCARALHVHCTRLVSAPHAHCVRRTFSLTSSPATTSSAPRSPRSPTPPTPRAPRCTPRSRPSSVGCGPF